LSIGADPLRVPFGVGVAINGVVGEITCAQFFAVGAGNGPARPRERLAGGVEGFNRAHLLVCLQPIVHSGGPLVPVGAVIGLEEEFEHVLGLILEGVIVVAGYGQEHRKFECVPTI